MTTQLNRALLPVLLLFATIALAPTVNASCSPAGLTCAEASVQSWQLNHCANDLLPVTGLEDAAYCVRGSGEATSFFPFVLEVEANGVTAVPCTGDATGGCTTKTAWFIATVGECVVSTRVVTAAVPWSESATRCFDLEAF